MSIIVISIIIIMIVSFIQVMLDKRFPLTAGPVLPNITSPARLSQVMKPKPLPPNQ